MPQVINVVDAPAGWETNPEYEYVGRGATNGWSNPYTVGWDGERDEVLSLYVSWLMMQLECNTSFGPRLHTLYGKILVCNCSPLPCHAEMLGHMAEGIGLYEDQRNKEYPNRPYYGIDEVGDMKRQQHLHKLVREIVMWHGARIRHDLSTRAEAAAKLTITGETGDVFGEWKLFRRTYLDPLLKWQLPVFRFPFELKAVA